MWDSPWVWRFSVEKECWFSYILLSTFICFFIDKCCFSCVSLFTFVFIFTDNRCLTQTFKILYYSLKSNTKVHQNHCINNKTWWFYQYLKTSISPTNSLRESRAMEKQIWGLLNTIIIKLELFYKWRSFLALIKQVLFVYCQLLFILPSTDITNRWFIHYLDKSRQHFTSIYPGSAERHTCNC